MWFCSLARRIFSLRCFSRSSSSSSCMVFSCCSKRLVSISSSNFSFSRNRSTSFRFSSICLISSFWYSSLRRLSSSASIRFRRSIVSVVRMVDRSVWVRSSINFSRGLPLRMYALGSLATAFRIGFWACDGEDDVTRCGLKLTLGVAAVDGDR
uniref:(northern house mosquito) hypothetical protein n=1 Tax=Culex pipiens TaxID=7175 RepID=A0A8D8EV10_CULPI